MNSLRGCLVGLRVDTTLSTGRVQATSSAGLRFDPDTILGLAVGVYNSVGNIAGMIQPIVSGFVIKLTGSYTPAFVLAAAMLAASSLSYWFIVSELKNANSSRDN